MKTVVYDMDGVLNWLCEDVAAMYGIPVANHYDTYKATNMTRREMDITVAAYHDPTVFDKVRWVEGADKIFDVKADVHIYSANLCGDVLDVKMRRCYDFFPPEMHDHIHLTLGKFKPPWPGADIVIEDSVQNLLKYPAQTIKLLITHPYNNEEVSGVIRVPDLMHAIRLVNIMTSG